MTTRTPLPPHYFQLFEKLELPFYAWDTRNEVEPTVGDFYMQGEGSGVYTRVEVIAVDSVAKTFVLQAVSAMELE